MAKSCPQDLVRDLVEGTLGGLDASPSDGESSSVDADPRLSEVLAHLKGCAPCRRLREELAEEEALVRAAVAEFGNRESPANDAFADDGDNCPTESQLAAFTEGAIDGSLRERLEVHVASCGLCRASFVAASVPVMVEVRDEVLVAARRRLAVARSTPAVARADSRRTRSSRSKGSRTGKYAPITAMPSRSGGLGLLVAAAAAVLVAIGVFALRESSEPKETVAHHDVDVRPEVRPSAAPSQSVAPRAVDSPEPATPVAGPETPGEPPVVAANTRPSDDEEDPAADEPGAAQGPRGLGPANSGHPTDDATRPSPAARPSSDPVRPSRDPVRPTSDPVRPTSDPTRRETPSGPVLGEKLRGTPTVLACAVSSLQGSVEVRKKDARAWRALSSSESLEEGDLVRAKGVDSGFTFADRAKVTLDADAVGRVSFEGKSVAIALEQGSIEGEALARYGLKITDANGAVTLWKGARVRAESLPEGLRVCVDAGRARMENALGHVLLREGGEGVSSRESAPRLSSRKGPRRTPRR